MGHNHLNSDPLMSAESRTRGVPGVYPSLSTWTNHSCSATQPWTGAESKSYERTDVSTATLSSTLNCFEFRKWSVALVQQKHSHSSADLSTAWSGPQMLCYAQATSTIALHVPPDLITAISVGITASSFLHRLSILFSVTYYRQNCQSYLRVQVLKVDEFSWGSTK